MDNFYIKTKTYLGHKSLSYETHLSPHPLMTKSLLGLRNQVSIIDISSTRSSLIPAFYILARVLKSQGSVLIVNTNPDFSRLVDNLRKIQQKTGSNKISFCNFKWVGGMLTNRKQIYKSVDTFRNFTLRFEKFLKQNNINFPRYKKMKKFFQGVVDNPSIDLPDLVFIINPNSNRIVIKEANALSIPVIALTDSNTDLSGITYPIPVNNNSLFFVEFCIRLLAGIVFKITKK